MQRVSFLINDLTMNHFFMKITVSMGFTHSLTKIIIHKNVRIFANQILRYIEISNYLKFLIIFTPVIFCGFRYRIQGFLYS